MPAGAWAGVNTTSPTTAPRFVLASRSSSRIARPDIARSLASTTIRSSLAAVQAGLTVSDEVALLGADDVAGLASGPVEQVALAARDVAEHRLEDVLEVPALRGRPGTLRARARGGGLDRREPVVELGEPLADLLAELVHRRAEPRGVDEQGELGRVAVEIRPEQLPIRPIALSRLVSSNRSADEDAELAAVAEELLQRPGQAAVDVGEVRAEDLRRARRPLARWPPRCGCRRPSNSRRTTSTLTVTPASWRATRPILRARSTRAASFFGGPLGDERRQPGIGQDETVDDDALPVEPDLGVGGALPGAGVRPCRPCRRRGRGAGRSDAVGEAERARVGWRELDDGSVLHDRSVGYGRDSSRVTVWRESAANTRPSRGILAWPGRGNPPPGPSAPDGSTHPESTRRHRSKPQSPARCRVATPFSPTGPPTVVIPCARPYPSDSGSL